MLLMSPSVPSALAPAQQAFVESGVSMAVAGRDKRNVPSLARAYGCRLLPDGRLALFVAPSQSAALLQDIAATRVVAVVFSRPSSHETIQIKGSDAEIRPLAPGELQRAQQLTEQLVVDILSLRFHEQGVRTLLTVDGADLVAVVFTPAAVFGQTPGPRAGERLEP